MKLLMCLILDQQADWADVSPLSNLLSPSSSVHWWIHTSGVEREELSWEDVQDAVWRAQCMWSLLTSW